MEKQTINFISEIFLTSAGFIITTSLAIIAYFITKYFTTYENKIYNLETKGDERNNYILKQIAYIESVLKEHSITIKSNKEIIEANIHLIKEQLKEVKISLENGFEDIKEQIKNK